MWQVQSQWFQSSQNSQNGDYQEMCYANYAKFTFMIEKETNNSWSGPHKICVCKQNSPESSSDFSRIRMQLIHNSLSLECSIFNCLDRFDYTFRQFEGNRAGKRSVTTLPWVSSSTSTLVQYRHDSLKNSSCMLWINHCSEYSLQKSYTG